MLPSFEFYPSSSPECQCKGAAESPPGAEPRPLLAGNIEVIQLSSFPSSSCRLTLCSLKAQYKVSTPMVSPAFIAPRCQRPLQRLLGRRNRRIFVLSSCSESDLKPRKWPQQEHLEEFVVRRSRSSQCCISRSIGRAAISCSPWLMVLVDCISLSSP